MGCRERTRNLMAVRKVFVTLVILFMIFSMIPISTGEWQPPHDTGTGSDPVASDNNWTTNGTWYIEAGETKSYDNITITLNGRLELNITAELTLDNCTIYFNFSNSDPYIFVNPHQDTYLIMKNCNVSCLDESNVWSFYIDYGGAHPRVHIYNCNFYDMTTFRAYSSQFRAYNSSFYTGRIDGAWVYYGKNSHDEEYPFWPSFGSEFFDCYIEGMTQGKNAILINSHVSWAVEAGDTNRSVTPNSNGFDWRFVNSSFNNFESDFSDVQYTGVMTTYEYVKVTVRNPDGSLNTTTNVTINNENAEIKDETTGVDGSVVTTCKSWNESSNVRTYFDVNVTVDGNTSQNFSIYRGDRTVDRQTNITYVIGWGFVPEYEISHTPYGKDFIWTAVNHADLTTLELVMPVMDYLESNGANMTWTLWWDSEDQIAGPVQFGFMNSTIRDYMVSHVVGKGMEVGSHSPTPTSNNVTNFTEMWGLYELYFGYDPLYYCEHGAAGSHEENFGYNGLNESNEEYYMIPFLNENILWMDPTGGPSVGERKNIYDGLNIYEDWNTAFEPNSTWDFMVHRSVNGGSVSRYEKLIHDGELENLKAQHGVWISYEHFGVANYWSLNPLDAGDYFFGDRVMNPAVSDRMNITFSYDGWFKNASTVLNWLWEMEHVSIDQNYYKIGLNNTNSNDVDGFTILGLPTGRLYNSSNNYTDANSDGEFIMDLPSGEHNMYFHPPTDSIVPDSSYTKNYLQVNFTDLSRSFNNWDDNYTIVSWDWDFGASGSSEQNPEFVYPGEGTYTVTLTIADEYGRSNSTSFDITVVRITPAEQIDALVPIVIAVTGVIIVISILGNGLIRPFNRIARRT